MNTVRCVLVVTLVAALGLSIAPRGEAQDKTGKEKKGANKAKGGGTTAKTSAATESVLETNLAYSLIHYARKHKSPEALLSAARILASQPKARKSDVKPETKRHTKEGEEGKKADIKVDNSPKALIAEARKLTKSAKILAAIDLIAKQIEDVQRDPVDGPIRRFATVPAYSTHTWRIKMRGKEAFAVAISGDGDTRLDLYVYDEDFNYITSRVGPGDDKMVTHVPAWTGDFNIRVVNRGGVANRYLFVAW